MGRLVVQDGRLMTDPEVINGEGHGHYCLEEQAEDSRRGGFPAEPSQTEATGGEQEQVRPFLFRRPRLTTGLGTASVGAVITLEWSSVLGTRVDLTLVGSKVTSPAQVIALLSRRTW